MAKLQVAIDLLSTKEALELAAKVAPYVDIIELGTPLIKSEGLAVIKAMKAAHPDKLVFADFKTADTGELEERRGRRHRAGRVGCRRARPKCGWRSALHGILRTERCRALAKNLFRFRRA